MLSVNSSDVKGHIFEMNSFISDRDLSHFSQYFTQNCQHTEMLKDYTVSNILPYLFYHIAI